MWQTGTWLNIPELAPLVLWPYMGNVLDQMYDMNNTMIHGVIECRGKNSRLNN